MIEDCIEVEWWLSIANSRKVSCSFTREERVDVSMKLGSSSFRSELGKFDIFDSEVVLKIDFKLSEARGGFVSSFARVARGFVEA